MNRLTRRWTTLRHIPILIVTGFAVACASPSPVPPERARPSAEVAAPVPPERVVRTYRDERGQLWDDQGKRVDEPR